jgi:hypothetical protein
MNYVCEVGLSIIIYVQSFIKTGSDIQKLMEGNAYSLVILQSYFCFSKSRNWALKKKGEERKYTD